MYKMIFISLLISLLFRTGFSQTYLFGELSDTTFTFKNNPYIINEALSIPKNVKITIEDGCIFLFNAYTGITVEGSLIVKGKENSKVVFTSINDSRYNPKAKEIESAFDWNGINIDLKSDSVSLENFEVAYSVFGLKSMNNRIVIHNGTFKENGQYNCEINKTIQSIEPETPFSFNYTPPKNDSLNTIALLKMKTHKKNILSLSLLGAGLASGGADGILFWKYFDYDKRYNELRNAPASEFDNLSTSRKNFKTAGIVLASASGTFLITSFVTFLAPVKMKSKKEKTSYNVFPTPGGLTFSIVF